MFVAACSSQTPDKDVLYPTCESRSNTDPGRLNIRAAAENFGAISPCQGIFEIYINKNSEVRALDLGLEFLNQNGDTLSKERKQVNLEESRTGMFQKDVSLQPIKGESCRSVQAAIRSITCYSTDGSVVECPEVRIHPPDAYRLIKIEDKSIEVCSPIK